MTVNAAAWAALDPGAVVARPKRALQRHFLAVGVAGLALLGSAMGVSFLGDTGTTSVSITPSSASSFVYAVTGANTTSPPLPTAVTALEYGAVPSWTPTPDSAGSVTTAGDVALVDATLSTVVVNIYITNLATLQSAYSSFALPVEIYSGTCSGSPSACTWTLDSTLTAANSVYITNTEGQLSFNLPSGDYYDITIPTGGSFYTLSSVSSTNDSPSFYVTGQAV